MEEQTNQETPKPMKTRVIALLAFIIAIGAITMTGYNAYQNYELRQDVAIVQNNTVQIMTTFNEYAVDRRDEMLSLRYTIADMWLKDLDSSAEAAVRNFEAANAEYYQCVYNNKKVEAIGLARNLWPEEESPAPAKYLVLQYDNHYLAYRNDGTVNCYSIPVADDRAPSTCSSFCEQTPVDVPQ